MAARQGQTTRESALEKACKREWAIQYELSALTSVAQPELPGPLLKDARDGSKVEKTELEDTRYGKSLRKVAFRQIE